MEKAVVFLSGILLSSAVAFAQPSVEAQIGFDNSKFRMKTENRDAQFTDAKMGIQAGINVKFGGDQGFYVKPGLQYHNLKTKSDLFNIGIFTSDLTFDMHYLQLPVALGYSYGISNGDYGYISAEFAPYIGYAVAGKTIGRLNNSETKTDIDWGTGNNETNPFDAGLKFGLGYKTPFNIFVNAGYTLGLANMNNGDNLKTNHRNWNFAIGYSFAL